VVSFDSTPLVLFEIEFTMMSLKTCNLFQLEPVGKKTTVWDVNDLACPSEVGGW